MKPSDAGPLGRRGQALVEFALLLPVLLLMVLGVIEFSRSLDAVHSMSTLSREGANLAARGTPLDTVALTVLTNGGEIGLGRAGGVVATEVAIDSAGWPIVRAQAFSPGFSRASGLGTAGDTAFGLHQAGLASGRRHYIVEIYYRFRPITPVGALLGFGVRDTLYERAIF